jgi:hypothetical protein
VRYVLDIFGVYSVTDIQQRQQPFKYIASLTFLVRRMQDILQPIDQQQFLNGGLDRRE